MSCSPSSSKDHAASTSFSIQSPYRPLRREASRSIGEDCDDAFIIPSKNAPLERLRRWRQATLVLNASRRFRYTLDLKKEEEKEQMRRKIRAHAQVIRAAILFREAGEGKTRGTTEGLPIIFSGGYGIGKDQLSSMIRDRNFALLQGYRGVIGLANLLKTNLEKGIGGDNGELLHRRNAFGSNTYPRKKGKRFWSFFVDAFKDLTLMILIAAAVASLALGMKTEGIKKGWYEGGSIAFAVILVVLVTAISDYRQSLQFRSLNEEKQNIRIEVTRGGRRIQISIYDIVVGDVVPLNIGDQVPADGVLISGYSLAIDESSMTGESKIIHKDPKAPFLISGCKVADGHGSMLVTGVGINTEWGLLMASISEDNGEETPLQVRLNGVATFVGKVGLTVAVFVLLVLVIRYFTGHTKGSDGAVKFKAGQTSGGTIGNDIVQMITIAVTIVVVAIPEGLPLAVTLTLAYSMRKMMADKALVRRLSACETMGSATTICSDKTGTLTLNQMTVVEERFSGDSVEDSNSLDNNINIQLLIEGIAQNTMANIFIPEDGGPAEVTGSPTEKAILSWGLFKLRMRFNEERLKTKILHVFPFNSEKKRGGVAILEGESAVRVHWKGAAEIVLASCTKWLDAVGVAQPMDGKRNEFMGVIEDMAKRSLRCLAFAYKSCDIECVPSNDEELEKWELPEHDLVLLAIAGLKDPCRPGVKDAVRLCTSAGVKVRMVTGDNLKTAIAIALECGILGSESDATEPYVIEGERFRNLSEDVRKNIAEQISVMGRSSPNDKLLLVKTLRQNGHVVAVTGDGTNDAPALHEADIGLAMGIQGTEVAKESSDIIILDDDFASVVKVVRWGRSVFANIQKFIQFQLTVNAAALFINVVAAVSTGNVPLNAVQLLWVNLIMDTLGALALATEPPTDDLMHRPPVGRSPLSEIHWCRGREPLVTNIMWRNLGVQALYQVAVLLVLNSAGESILHLKHTNSDDANKEKNTVIFNSFVLCQIFNEFNSRKPDKFNVFRGVTRNYLFMGIIVLTVIIQILIIELAGTFAKTTRLDWKLWLVCIGIGFISWPLAVLGKLIPVPKKQISPYFAHFNERCNEWCLRLLCCKRPRPQNP